MMFTASYGGLFDLAHLVKGETIIINAASCSVGLAAIQIDQRSPTLCHRYESTRAIAHVVDRQRYGDMTIEIRPAKTLEDVRAVIGPKRMCAGASVTASRQSRTLRCAAPSEGPS